jgi:hypothetical protein
MVRDESQTYKGRVAVKRWNAAARDKYHDTVEPIELNEIEDNIVVTGRVSGDFPGNPINLKCIFTLSGSKIKSLIIR